MKQSRAFNLLTSPLVISFFLLIILLIAMSNGYMNNDEGMWSYMGRIWSEHNMPPYIGAIENKTPGIFELFAISHILFGVNVFFVRALGVIAILLSSLTIYLTGRELHSHLAGIFSMVIFGLTMTWSLLDGKYTAQTETFMVLFSTLSFYFVIKGVGSPKWRFWIFLSGLSMGLALAFKQIALTTAIALFIFFLLYGAYGLTNKDKIVGIFLVCLGVIISTFLSLAPLLFSNVSLREYIDGAWLILLNPGSSASAMLRIKGFFHIFLNSRIVVFYPFLGLFIGQSDLIKHRYFIGLLIWMLFDFIGVNASGYYYGHQIKQLIPSLSIIIGILLGNFLLRHIIEKSELTKYTSVLLIFIIVLLFPFQSLIGYKAMNGYVDNEKELGMWLKENTKENDYVYIAGGRGNAILSYCGRISSSKYFNMIFVTSDKEREQLLSDLKEKPPLYFLKPSVDIGIKIDEFVSNNYKLVYTKQEYEIFKWKSD